MFMLTRRQTSFPRHWPIHVAGVQGPGTPHTAEAGEPSPAACHAASGPADGGGLTASPWLGLHYETERG